MKKQLLIKPSDITPIKDDLQVIGAFNPGATVVDDRLVMLVRVAVTLRESRDGQFAWLRFINGELRIDWLPIDDFDTADSRVMRRRQDGKILLSSLSYLQTAWIDNYRDAPDEWRIQFGAAILPESEYETYGIEDARCTWIDGCCFVTYTSVSSHGASTSLMTTKDFQSYVKQGVIFVCENKDVVLFPERVDGEIFALHRPVSATRFCAPEIWSASSQDGLCWGHHHVLASGSEAFEADRIGAGTPPVRIGQSYLAIYHASEQAHPPARVGRYVGSLMELVIGNGRVQLLRRARQPLLIPTEDWELDGFIPNVVFPTAMIAVGDSWIVFYGAADSCVGVVEFSAAELFESLRNER